MRKDEISVLISEIRKDTINEMRNDTKFVRDIIHSVIDRSWAYDFVDLCASEECKQLIDIQGSEYFGGSCEVCENIWCVDHRNELIYHCEDCGYSVCSGCSTLVKCNVCGILSNHDCEWSTKCECQHTQQAKTE